MEDRQTERQNENVNRGLLQSEISVMSSVILWKCDVKCEARPPSLNAWNNGSGLKCASLSHHHTEIGSWLFKIA